MKTKSISKRRSSSRHNAASNKLAEFIASVELSDIFLQSLKCECSKTPPIIDPTKTFIEVEPSVGMRKGRANLIVMSSLYLKAVPFDGKVKADEVLFSIKITLALLYKVDLESFSEEIIRLFVERNATYNAWPFHREIISSTMARMRIPPYYLQLLSPYARKNNMKESKALKKEAEHKPKT